MKCFFQGGRAFTSPLLLLLTLLLASNQAVLSQLVCQMPLAPVVQTGSLTAGDSMQSGRINRNGITGSCPAGKTNAIFNADSVVQDNYTFEAPVTGCATVDFDATACGGATTQVVAYSTYNPSSPGSNIISDFGFSTTGTASFGFPVVQGTDYTIVVHDILEPSNIFCTNYTFTITYRTDCRSPGYDRTNDGEADPTYVSSAGSFWNTANSAGGTESKQFGVAGDIPTAGDYTGDGMTDVSVYRPSTNIWYVGNDQANPAGNFTSVPFGIAADVPVSGDYDGDGAADVAVWRPGTGFWYVLRSSDQTIMAVKWGRNGDIPVTGDFDGDLKTDFAVVRPDKVGITPNYNWYFLLSNFNYGFSMRSVWGLAGDKLVPADYDANGKADIAVFRPSDGNWYTLPMVSQNSAPLPSTGVGVHWGTDGDIPQPADYNNDLIADTAVFRPSDGNWYIFNSTTATIDILNWGTAADTPATAPYPIRP